MKKFLAALTMLTIFLTSSIALAAYEESVEEDADLTTIKKMAVAFPNYYKVEDKEPDIYELTRDIYNAGRLTSNLEMVSYDDVAAAIRRDTGIDIYSLDDVEAEKIYLKNIYRYADSYLVTTIANNSGMPWFFFYVYNSTDQKLMYTYSLQSNSLGKNSKDYGKAAENFYKQFDTTSAMNLSKEDKQKLKEKKKEAKAKKRNIKRTIYKTGKSKEDLVRK